MPIDHTSLHVSSLPQSKAFYLTALAPLKYKLFMENDCVIGFIAPRAGPDFWISSPSEKKNTAGGVTNIHVAFKGTSKKMVRDFHASALKAGATCNGPPGERPQYTKGYYAAYVLDPDGHNIECVYFQIWWMTALQWAPSVLGGTVIGALAWWVGRTGWSF